MMYDTVVVNSPYLSPEQVYKVIEFCDRIQKMKMGSGELDYEFYVSEFSTGSYDYRIRIKLMDKEWVHYAGKTMKVDIERRYLRVECSLHKLIMGHNLFGGPKRVRESIAYLVKELEKCIGCNLPDYKLWTVDRIDVASVYDLGTYENAKEFLDRVKHVKFPRRTNVEIYKTSIAWRGYVSYHKHYLKYDEFIKHDYKVMRKKILSRIDELYGNRDDFRYIKQEKYKNALIDLNLLKEKIKGLYRVETEIKKEKLKDLFDESIIDYVYNNIKGDLRKGVYVFLLEDKILFEYARSVLENLFKDCKEGENMDDRKVLRIIEESYPNMKNQLFATYTMLKNFGYDYAKSQMKERTFYYHLRKLRDMGIKWNSLGEIKKDKNDINVFEFYNFMIDKLEIDGESEEVKKALDSVA